MLTKEPLDNILANVFAQAQLEESACRRDREIRARDVLLQRRQGEAVPGEEREMVPSPKVATYDLMPEMSAEGVATW